MVLASLKRLLCFFHADHWWRQELSRALRDHEAIDIEVESQVLTNALVLLCLLVREQTPARKFLYQLDDQRDLYDDFLTQVLMCEWEPESGLSSRRTIASYGMPRQVISFVMHAVFRHHRRQQYSELSILAPKVDI